MSKPLTFVYKKVEHVSIELDVWLPEQSSSKNTTSIPALVWFHGGGGAAGDKGPDKSRLFAHWIKDFTTKINGHAFISANYRLLLPCTAHDMLEDIKDVFRYIQESLATTPIGSSSFTIDPKKLAVGGESFGGYCARLGGLYAAPKPKAVFSMYGGGGDLLSPFHLNGATDASDMPFRHPLMSKPNKVLDDILKSDTVITSTRLGRDKNGQSLTPRQDLAFYLHQDGRYLDILTGVPGLSATIKSNAGSKGAKKWAGIPVATREILPQLVMNSSFPPTFLIHGIADSAVLIHESEETERQLKELGVEVHFIRVEGAEHVFDAACKVEDGNPLWGKLKPVQAWLKEILA